MKVKRKTKQNKKTHSLLWLENLQIVINLQVIHWNQNHGYIWHSVVNYDISIEQQTMILLLYKHFWKIPYIQKKKKGRKKLQLRISLSFMLTSKDSSNYGSSVFYPSTCSMKPESVPSQYQHFLSQQWGCVLGTEINLSQDVAPDSGTSQ